MQSAASASEFQLSTFSFQLFFTRLSEERQSAASASEFQLSAFNFQLFFTRLRREKKSAASANFNFQLSTFNFQLNLRRTLAAWFEFQVAEHGACECEPGGVGVGDAVHGALGDAGMGGAEAVHGGLPAEEPFLLQAAAGAVAEEAVGAGDPDALEGVNDAAARIAKDGVVEAEGFALDLIGALWLVLGESHADGSHANVGQVFEGFEHIVGVDGVPLEKGAMDGHAVIEVDARGRAGGAMQRGQRLGDNLGQLGGGGRGEVGGRRAEGGGRRSEVGGRRSEVGGRRSEGGGRRAEVGGRRR